MDPLSSLADIQSQESEVDEIGLGQAHQWEIRDCCAHVFAETWIHRGIPDWVMVRPCFVLTERLLCPGTLGAHRFLFCHFLSGGDHSWALCCCWLCDIPVH